MIVAKIKLSKCIEFFCLGLSMRISLQMTTVIQSEQMYGVFLFRRVNAHKLADDDDHSKWTNALSFSVSALQRASCKFSKLNMSLDLLSQRVKAKMSKCIEFFCLGLSMRISLQMTTIIQSGRMYWVFLFRLVNAHKLADDDNHSKRAKMSMFWRLTMHLIVHYTG